MKSKGKKFYVRWTETHETQVVASDEQAAIRKALEMSTVKNRSAAEQTIAIAA